MCVYESYQFALCPHVNDVDDIKVEDFRVIIHGGDLNTVSLLKDG